MNPSAPDLRPIAHAALCLDEPPYLKHYRGGRSRTWNGVAFTGSDLPGPGFNFAAVLHQPAPTLDELLPVAHEFFAAARQGWGVLVEGDAGHPMEAELRGRGWRVEEDEPAFVMPDLASGTRPASPPGFAIRPVRTANDEAAYHRVAAVAFAPPPELAAELLPADSYFDDPELALFVGAVAGVDVAVTGYSRSGTTAVVWGLGTLEPYRGRGYGAALVRAALADAAGRGCTSAALRSGPKSVPLYERLGFRYVCQHRTYAAPAT